MSDRDVILLCGPPGAGKSTYAAQHYPDYRIYDLDHAQWGGDERRFRRALGAIRTQPHARAVVIRSGARRSTRATWALAVGATAVVVLPVEPAVCRARIIVRNRDRQPLDQQLAAVATWWDRYEPEPTRVGEVSRAW
jgi:hypothetical protein